MVGIFLRAPVCIGLVGSGWIYPTNLTSNRSFRDCAFLSGWPVLALFAAMSAVINIVYFVIPVLSWLTVAFRPDQNPEIIRVFNDFGWFTMLWPFSSTVMQNILFGVVILSDKREKPLFPRWVGFFTITEGLMVLPGGLIPFFKVGPFAWNGILAFWLVATTYLIWIIVVSFALHRSIKIVMQEEFGNSRI